MYIVMGNGESRSAIDYSLLEGHITYGCNAIYRDFAPTNLVVIDNKMLHEVVTSGYVAHANCYFRNFTLVPPLMYNEILSGISLNERTTIIENKSTGFAFAYYGQEKTTEFYPETHTMCVVDKPVHYFTWVTSQDKIFDLNDYISSDPQDSGQSAVELCCQVEKPETIYLLGFDLIIHNGLVNNIYKSTDCYAPDYALPVDGRGWVRDLNIIFDKYSNTKFIHVQDVSVFDNLETISVEQFRQLL